jgi:hypothetical protein
MERPKGNTMKLIELTPINKVPQNITGVNKLNADSGGRAV